MLSTIIEPALVYLRDRKYAPLALISFATLYLEIVIIRWLASDIRIFAYFKNFPLLASFLGFGIGCILAPRQRNYFRFAPVLLFLVTAVIGLAPRWGYTHIVFADPLEYYLLGTYGPINPFRVLKGTAAVLGIFALIVALFVALGERVGEYLNQVPPLAGYSINVGFSLAGVLFYALLSQLRTGPATWILVAGLALFPFFRKALRFAPLLAAIVLATVLRPQSVTWSPYYRLDVAPLSLESKDGKHFPVGFNIQVNHDLFQGAYNHSDTFLQSLPADVRYQFLDYYNVPFRIFEGRFHKVAVLGAGAGNDVAAALRHGVTRVDAVEIDPAIVDIGRQLHPEQPYASNRVQVHVTDARAFLRNSTNSKYDLIIFAALDSHTVFSSMSSLRLDNYVYTVESFRDALQRLGPDGVIAVTFYPFKLWQIERVYNALWRANGEKPVAVHSLGRYYNNIVFLAGPGIQRSTLLQDPYVAEHNAEGVVGNGKVEPTTDDWPFLYLRERGLSGNYLSMLAVILCFSLLVTRRIMRTGNSRPDAAMFLLGAGFMLLETKTLAKMSLLLGATWTVNTVVISAVLLMILLSNLVVSKRWLSSVPLCLLAVVALLLMDWCLRSDILTFLPRSNVSLGLIASFFALPVFFAGVLFARLYRASGTPSSALGYNLLGAMLGGALEYSCTALGINNLNLLCSGAYVGVAAVIIFRQLQQQPAAARMFISEGEA